MNQRIIKDDVTSALAVGEFFHRTQWAVDEIAGLAPSLQMDIENLKAAHYIQDVEIMAKCTEELTRHLNQTFKVLEPFIGQLENHPPLKAALDAQRVRKS